MDARLKQIIFNKLDKDLCRAEIIVDDDKSIWFIDRKNKYWYLELRSSGTLWWRYSFFHDFFPLFGMERKEYEPVIAEWVKGVLKREVSSTFSLCLESSFLVKEVFKREVSSTQLGDIGTATKIRQILTRHVFSNTEKVFSLKAGVIENKMKMKKFLKS